MSVRLGIVVALVLFWTILVALLWAAVRNAQAQLPPSYYGLTPGPPLINIGPENAVEPPPGQLPIVVPPEPMPLPPPPPSLPLMSYYVMPAPPIVSFDDELDDLTPLIVTRVILTRECFRYAGRWRCTQPK